MLILGLERYTENDIAFIVKLKPDCVVLGDILCNKKMFPFSGREIPEIMKTLRDNEIDIFYQTPMYATDRVFENILEDVKYFYKKELTGTIIVQDIGLANALKKECPQIKLIWGKMGYARTPTMNIATLDYFRKIGIESFECKSVQEARKVIQLGRIPYLLIGAPTYTTINRECYYKYEHDIYDDKCECGCLKRDKMIIPGLNNIETYIDGYVLGYQNVYLQESISEASNFENCIIYVQSIEQAEKYMKILSRR